MTDLIALVEAAYTSATSESEWLDGVLRASRPMLDDGRGVLAFIHDTTAPDWVELRAVGVLDVAPALVAAMFNAPMVERGDETRTMVQIFRTLMATNARRELPRAPPKLRAQFEQGLRAAGVADARFVNATDPSHFAVGLIAPTGTLKRMTPREIHSWRRLSAHISTGLRMHRLRTSLSAMRDSTLEAVMRPDGRVEHAEGPARDVEARTALQQGVLAQERARGPLRREDSEGALTLWEGLVAGRWSLVDQFDSDGRRYLVAHRNDPDAPDVRGLTLRERQVVAYAAAGHPNKVIAYELGLTTSTIAGHLAQARAKLALPSAVSMRQMLAGLCPSSSMSNQDEQHA
jgi:DNA-binding CsgD family transcriptional regulator